MSFTLVYISFSYKKELEANIEGALRLMLSDIAREHLDFGLHHEEMDFFSNEVKKSAYGNLFDDMKIKRLSQLPEYETDRISTYEKLADKEYLYLSCSRELLNKKVMHFTLSTFALFIIIYIILAGAFFLYIRSQFRSLHCLVDFCTSQQEDMSITPVCNGTYEVKNLRNAI